MSNEGSVIRSVSNLSVMHSRVQLALFHRNDFHYLLKYNWWCRDYLQRI